MEFLLEIAVDTLEDAIAAQRGGADRLELCADLAADGLTPSEDLLRAVRSAVSLPIFAMVRPRAGDFVYTDEEFAAMEQQVLYCTTLGADGIVTGILTNDRNIDSERTKRLVTLAHPLPVTFHRAFDAAGDPLAALDAVIATGATRLLTSGQQPNAFAGRELMRRLRERSEGKLGILPGAGIDRSNARHILEETGARELHCAKGVKRIEADGVLRVDPAMVAELKTLMRTSVSA